MVDIGQKIREIREVKGFSQDYMATQLDMSPNGYGKIERGETDVSFSRLQKIAEVFEMELTDLLAFKGRLSIFQNSHNKDNSQNSFTFHCSSKEQEVFETKIAALEREIALQNELLLLYRQQNKPNA